MSSADLEQFFADYLSKNAVELGKLIAKVVLDGLTSNYVAALSGQPPAPPSEPPLHRQLTAAAALQGAAANPLRQPIPPTATRAREATMVSAAGTSIRPQTCVGPGCEEPSRGPRYGYCCPKHFKAPKAQRDAWRSEYIENERRKLGMPVKERSASKRSMSDTESTDERIIELLLAAGDEKLTTASIVEATGLPLATVRSRLGRMREKGKVASEGRTSNASYYVTATFRQEIAKDLPAAFRQ
jgi:hypothetical protein